MNEIREILIQLRYARQKIEHIEGELKKSCFCELRVEIDGVIGALHIAKAILQEGAKPKG